MALSADGVYEAEGYDDDSVLVVKHDRSKGTNATFQLAPPASARGPEPSHIAFTPDNNYLAASTRDLTIRLYDLQHLAGQSAPPTTLATEKFSHPGR
jgi:hypothetical protein